MRAKDIVNFLTGKETSHNPEETPNVADFEVAAITKALAAAFNAGVEKSAVWFEQNMKGNSGAYYPNETVASPSDAIRKLKI